MILHANVGIVCRLQCYQTCVCCHQRRKEELKKTLTKLGNNVCRLEKALVCNETDLDKLKWLVTASRSLIICERLSCLKFQRTWQLNVLLWTCSAHGKGHFGFFCCALYNNSTIKFIVIFIIKLSWVKECVEHNAFKSYRNYQIFFISTNWMIRERRDPKLVASFYKNCKLVTKGSKKLNTYLPF